MSGDLLQLEFFKSQIGVGHENFKGILGGGGQTEIGRKIYIIVSSAK